MKAPPTGRADRDFWWSTGRMILAPIAAMTFRQDVRGLENIPAEGGGILASNHVSVLDPVLLGLAASRRGRTVRFVGTAETWHAPVVGWGLRRIRQIPIVRGGADLEALEIAARVVRSGALAGIYPEGTVGPGPLMAGHRGAARLALASGGALIPVGIWGTNARRPKAGWTFAGPRRPIAAISVGTPIVPDGSAASPEDVRALTDRLMAAIADQVAAARTRAPVP